MRFPFGNRESSRPSPGEIAGAPPSPAETASANPEAQPESNDLQDRITEKTWAIIRSDEINSDEDASTALERLRDSPDANDQARYHEILTQAASHAHLEHNLDQAEQEWQQKYNTGVRNKVENWLNHHPKVNKVFGWLKTAALVGPAAIAARSAVSGIAAATSMAALPAAILGGIATGGVAGGITGFRTGKQAYEQQQFTQRQVEQDLDTDKLINTNVEELETNNPSHLDEYYENVQDALDVYRQMEARNITQENRGLSPESYREFISRFYANKARLEHIIQARQIRNETNNGEPLSLEQRADALSRALESGRETDRNRNRECMSERAQTFINSRLNERRKSAWKQAGKQGLIGALIGGTTAGVIHGIVDSVHGFVSAEGGHWNYNIAQERMIGKPEFTQLVDQIQNGNTHEATQLAYKLHLAPGENILQDMHDRLAEARSLGVDERGINKIAYNLLSYVNHHPEGMSVEQFNNLLLDKNFFAEHVKDYINAETFHKLSFTDGTGSVATIDQLYRAYALKIGHIVPFWGNSVPGTAAFEEDVFGVLAATTLGGQKRTTDTKPPSPPTPPQRNPTEPLAPKNNGDATPPLEPNQDNPESTSPPENGKEYKITISPDIQPENINNDQLVKTSVERALKSASYHEHRLKLKQLPNAVYFPILEKAIVVWKSHYEQERTKPQENQRPFEIKAKIVNSSTDPSGTIIYDYEITDERILPPSSTQAESEEDSPVAAKTTPIEVARDETPVFEPKVIDFLFISQNNDGELEHMGKIIKPTDNDSRALLDEITANFILTGSEILNQRYKITLTGIHEQHWIAKIEKRESTDEEASQASELSSTQAPPLIEQPSAEANPPVATATSQHEQPPQAPQPPALNSPFITPPPSNNEPEQPQRQATSASAPVYRTGELDI